MTKSILALDLALNAGYAQFTEGEPKPRAGLLEIERKQELGGRLAQLYRWLLRVTKEWAVTDICIETPLVGGQAAGQEKVFFWLISTYGVTAMAGAQCRTNGVPINVVPIANSSMFVHWAGSKNDARGDLIPKELRKTYSILEAQRRGLGRAITIKDKSGVERQDHNIADAFGVLSLRCCQLNLQTPWDSKRSPGPLFTSAAMPKGTMITKSNKAAAQRIMARTSFNRGD